MTEHIFSGGTVSYSTDGKEWHELSNAVTHDLQIFNEGVDQIRNEARRILHQIFTIQATVTPSPEFWGIIVGMQLRYGLRELHRNLGRYCQWPYTN